MIFISGALASSLLEQIAATNIRFSANNATFIELFKRAYERYFNHEESTRFTIPQEARNTQHPRPIFQYTSFEVSKIRPEGEMLKIMFVTTGQDRRPTTSQSRAGETNAPAMEAVSSPHLVPHLPVDRSYIHFISQHFSHQLAIFLSFRRDALRNHFGQEEGEGSDEFESSGYRPACSHCIKSGKICLYPASQKASRKASTFEKKGRSTAKIKHVVQRSRTFAKVPSAPANGEVPQITLPLPDDRLSHASSLSSFSSLSNDPQLHPMASTSPLSSISTSDVAVTGTMSSPHDDPSSTRSSPLLPLSSLASSHAGSPDIFISNSPPIPERSFQTFSRATSSPLSSLPSSPEPSPVLATFPLPTVASPPSYPRPPPGPLPFRKSNMLHSTPRTPFGPLSAPIPSVKTLKREAEIDRLFLDVPSYYARLDELRCAGVEEESDEEDVGERRKGRRRVAVLAFGQEWEKKKKKAGVETSHRMVTRRKGTVGDVGVEAEEEVIVGEVPPAVRKVRRAPQPDFWSASGRPLRKAARKNMWMGGFGDSAEEEDEDYAASDEEAEAEGEPVAGEGDDVATQWIYGSMGRVSRTTVLSHAKWMAPDLLRRRFGLSMEDVMGVIEDAAERTNEVAEVDDVGTSTEGEKGPGSGEPEPVDEMVDEGPGAAVAVSQQTSVPSSTTTSSRHADALADDEEESAPLSQPLPTASVPTSIPVFEYPLNGQTIMIDTETGMVHFTGIWKALGHTKMDAVKLIESQPASVAPVAGVVRKVRGGFLKIQGTWLPYEIAHQLAKRVAWNIRHELVPIFGPDFAESCIAPGEPGFGQVVLSEPRKKGRRVLKNPEARAAAQAAAQAAQNNSAVITSSQVAATRPILSRIADGLVAANEEQSGGEARRVSGAGPVRRVSRGGRATQDEDDELMPSTYYQHLLNPRYSPYDCSTHSSHQQQKPRQASRSYPVPPAAVPAYPRPPPLFSTKPPPFTAPPHHLETYTFPTSHQYLHSYPSVLSSLEDRRAKPTTWESKRSYSAGDYSRYASDVDVSGAGRTSGSRGYWSVVGGSEEGNLVPDPVPYKSLRTQLSLPSIPYSESSLRESAGAGLLSPSPTTSLQPSTFPLQTQSSVNATHFAATAIPAPSERLHDVQNTLVRSPSSLSPLSHSPYLRPRSPPKSAGSFSTTHQSTRSVSGYAGRRENSSAALFTTSSRSGHLAMVSLLDAAAYADRELASY
ncbi:hypothetical protein MNV49_006317 [Pseudohyphozyma bogoriensis]|nr:hypothetical protein MNV49_006317 [Pseudohyphozyma bogoriensis]